MSGAGVAVECISAGTAYRLNGSQKLLDALALELEAIEGATLAHEPAPADRIDLSINATPSHPYRRTFTVHGQGEKAAGWVVRAVERRLSVQTVGVNRWAVSGRTAALVDWLAAVWPKPAEEVLQVLGLTPDQVAAEDNPALSISMPAPVVNVSLPDRRIESEITRDGRGDIVKVTQLETTA